MALNGKSSELYTQNGTAAVGRLLPTDRIIALAGNPNVGKSTLFNELTGMKQHTGNWTGKTVALAYGRHRNNQKDYIIVDLPGTYSLLSHSYEEEIARDFIILGGADATVVVCDATVLERNLNLALQTLEITDKVVICINLMDEAVKKGVEIDLKKLEDNLGVPVRSASARIGKGIDPLIKAVETVAFSPKEKASATVKYNKTLESCISLVEPAVKKVNKTHIHSRWIALKLIEGEKELTDKLSRLLCCELVKDGDIALSLEKARRILKDKDENYIEDTVAQYTSAAAQRACKGVCHYSKKDFSQRDRKLDKLLTSKLTGIPVMILLLLTVFWITLTGANYPSQLLSAAFLKLQETLYAFFVYINMPVWLNELFLSGIYKTLSGVISVMLPPMAIFFPLFTLLEDFGYLPRIAFNLDHHFKKADTCGKQALTMAMGFGCNAAGVVGCRIIDSPRERLIAMLTNSFVPCNGRFPMLIALITMFFAAAPSRLNSLKAAAILTAVIVFCVFMSLLMSKLLSKTVLRGIPSSFILELPPYRKPQFLKVIIRSVFDRTLFVLGRAVIVAIPAGIVIWIMANIKISDITLLDYCTDFLDPFAALFGLDGVILAAFILGLPANEIVVPIMTMAYLSTSSLTEIESLSSLQTVFINNGWTWASAVSVIIFTVMHWPCSTTCLSIKKETKSVKWTLLAIALPTAAGLTVCFIFNLILGVFQP